MKISRRYFIKSGGIAMLGMASLPSFLQRAVAETTGPTKKKMVVLFQRGAMDGLNVVVPFAEPNYFALRPTIEIPKPQRGGADAALDLDKNDAQAAEPEAESGIDLQPHRGTVLTQLPRNPPPTSQLF